MCPTNNVNTLLHSVARLCKQVVSCVQWQTLDQTLPAADRRCIPRTTKLPAHKTLTGVRQLTKPSPLLGELPLHRMPLEH